MTRVTNSDHVLLLLQEQLKRLGRERAGRSHGTKNGSKATPRPLARLHALAALDQLSEEDVSRTLVRALLSEELGEAVANDPAFQNIVEDVFRVISSSPEGRDLVDRAARQLCAGT